MKTFFNKLFRRIKPDATQSQGPNTGQGLSIQEGSESATRRQLVQVLLRDVLRKSGIPPGWIECHMLTVSSRSRGKGMYLRLIVKHWDPRLMDYAFAFQNTLMADIEKFESNASSWLHGISWQLELGDTCPYQTLPEKAYWQDTITKPEVAVSAALLASLMPDDLPATMQAATPAIAVPLARFESTADDEIETRDRDLESLFAIRDKELSSPDIPAAGYEKTQPAPL
jgi:hypothetical protein